MSIEGSEQGAVADVPQEDRNVIGARRRHPSIGREGNTVDRVRVPIEGSERAPSLTFHKRTLPSNEPDASVPPSGEKATLSTDSVCPSRVWSRKPSLTRHKRILLS